ncbi:YraN family protein [Candidatus Latescibacterota bacterium]
MSSSLSTGLQGEEIACRYLTNKGYGIIERNYRCSHLEIDIIAGHGDIIIFCEVKTARTKKFGPSISWVTPQKIKRIAKTAQEYIATHDTDGFSFRFDVIGIEVNCGKISINHIENAFIAPEDMDER